MRWTRVILLTVAMLGMSAVAWAELNPHPHPDPPPAPEASVVKAASAPAATSAQPVAAPEAADKKEDTEQGLGIMALFIVFILACFLGVELINKVPPTLHTPLMSGSNAMSGITIVGALMLSNIFQEELSTVTITQLGIEFDLAAVLACVALIFATINVVGGFLVTDRMLKMFKKGS